MGSNERMVGKKKKRKDEKGKEERDRRERTEVENKKREGKGISEATGRKERGARERKQIRGKWKRKGKKREGKRRDGTEEEGRNGKGGCGCTFPLTTTTTLMQIQQLDAETVSEMRHVKKLDMRMNRLVLTALETNYFSVFERLTHVDVRDNRIGELDVTGVRTLEYLNCERNAMSCLRANGTALKNLFAACNCESTHRVKYSI